MTSNNAPVLSREQILAFRRRASCLGQRLAAGSTALQKIAAAGLQDSMPRAALLSIHARMSGTESDTWEDPTLAQVWGPRYSAYVVARSDVGVFTLGRMSDDAKSRARAEGMAARLEVALEGEAMDCRVVASGMGVHPNALRYAAPTGRFLIRWDGSRQPHIWAVPGPDLEPTEARLELARRHLRVFGPSTPDAFATWAGVKTPFALKVFAGLGDELREVATPIGPGWVLASDLAAFDTKDESNSVRLLPSGDTYFLLQGDARGLLVPDPERRSQLWTSRVWPGAVLVDGEVVGTWRRAQHRLTVDPWVDLDGDQRRAIETEAATMPLPGLTQPVEVVWDS